MPTPSFKEILITLLKNDARLVDEQDDLRENLVHEYANELDPQLIELLLNDSQTRERFFLKIKDVYVFKQNDFRFFLDENKLDNSYTQFENKIGLSFGSRLLRETSDVVLNFPYKDCILEGGQSTEEGNDIYFEFDVKEGDYVEKKAKRKEVFFNQILARDEIDRLLEPKAFTNIKRFTKDGEEKLKGFTRDENGTIKDNLIIKGNNLLALHCLKKEFRGKVKLIYIDPPYYFIKDKKDETFVYNSNFKFSSWLTFIQNRLVESRELLREDGIIFISISIDGHAYLKILTDEVFGKNNFLGDIIWQTATDNNPSQVKNEHEYILAFAKNKNIQSTWKTKSLTQEILLKKYDELKEELKEDIDAIQISIREFIKKNKNILEGITHYDNVDSKGIFHDADIANTRQGGYRYDVIHPITKGVCKIPDFGFRFPKSTLEEMIKNDDVMFGNDENTLIKPKTRLENVRDTLRSVIYEDGRKSTKELEEMFYRGVFSNPKSSSVLKRIFSFILNDNDICLDFFAGSGTTAQAILQLNKEDGGNRQFIMVEQMNYAETITAKRVQKVMQKENIDISFIYLELAKNNQNAIEQIEKAENLEALNVFFEEMCEKYFLHYNVKIKEFREKISKEGDFIKLPLARQKEIYAKMLDLNQLYVNVSDMQDSRYALSKEDISLTNDFYKN